MFPRVSLSTWYSQTSWTSFLVSGLYIHIHQMYKAVCSDSPCNAGLKVLVAVLPDSVCDAGIVIFALVLSESECNECCNLIGI